MSVATWRPWFLLPILFSISGCSIAGGVTEGCAGFKPILLSRQDALTRQTEDAILAHNETGMALKCWSAPG